MLDDLTQEERQDFRERIYNDYIDICEEDPDRALDINNDAVNWTIITVSHPHPHNCAIPTSFLNKAEPLWYRIDQIQSKYADYDDAPKEIQANYDSTMVELYDLLPKRFRQAYALKTHRGKGQNWTIEININ